MASPGQKRGSCGHVMALFDSHLKCACCRDKGIGDDPCVRRNSARFVTIYLNNRSYSWPPLPTG